MTTEPTEAQWKEVLEWCGFLIEEHSSRFEHWYTYTPPEEMKLEFQFRHQYPCPSIDPTNLFLYAVPIAIDKIMSKEKCSSDFAYAVLFKKWLEKLQLDIPNHEGTLFWTIWEVKNDTG